MNESVYKNYSTTSSSNIVLVNCLINIPLMLAAILGNSLVLAAILTSTSLRSRASMILLAGLAVSDLAVGLFTQPFYIAQELSLKYGLIAKISYTMSSSLIGISLATMALISVDRLLVLQCHMSYYALVTTPRVIFILVFIWILHFFVSCIRLVFNAIFTSVAYVLLGGYNVASIICYVNIYRVVRRHQSQIRIQQRAAQGSNKETSIRNIAAMTYAALNTFVFYMCACFCYFPRVIYFLSRGVNSDPIDSNTPWVFTATLIFANSAINPLLYCWRLRELRIAVKSTLAKISCSEQQQNN